MVQKWQLSGKEKRNNVEYILKIHQKKINKSGCQVFLDLKHKCCYRDIAVWNSLPHQLLPIVFPDCCFYSCIIRYILSAQPGLLYMENCSVTGNINIPFQAVTSHMKLFVTSNISYRINRQLFLFLYYLGKNTCSANSDEHGKQS